ncbi:hypothetical protein [Amaricoccus solimangrovi]|uniref:Uncharacterized protein n=1 Tax=Amaricoccus solimangrovi TaxID=2589815 RepID=A0A501WWS3_9RHOB|nr:hypothetical protein [Amaricoccus solimangrovi]TPE52705.1 hypothetical protein FJM51_05900 [Amaricoccus solimangrovi]
MDEKRLMMIEARAAAQTRLIAMVIAELDRQGGADRLWEHLEEREVFQGGEEDPGVVPSEAYAFEAAVAEEMRRVIEAARGFAGRFPS